MEIPYAAQFATLTTAHLLGVVSPGPDFAMVVRQSVARGRAAGLWTSLGIGCGLVAHVSAAVLGVGLLLARSPVAARCLQYAGAAYLVWVGLHALRARPAAADPADPAAVATAAFAGWRAGLLTNLFNVKAALFIVSLWSVVVDARTPVAVQAAYGAWMVLLAVAWFALVALLLSRPGVRGRFLRRGHWFERAMGVVLIALGVRLATASLTA